jgi:sugar lactone lactonase YvrE
LASNDRLAGLERWSLPGGAGPEDVAFGLDGSLYTGIEDGRILCYPPSGDSPETIANTGGRPLGIEVDGDGTLVVCDPFRGLLRVDPRDGSVTVLVNEFEGRRLIHIDNADIAGDGSIYFSDSTPRWDLDNWMAAIYENQPNGILYRYDPSSEEIRVAAEGFAYSNGVALAPDDSFVLVAETARYRIHRVWLKGPKAGTKEPFIDNLPGFPDNVSTTDDGRFWVALPSKRDAFIDRMWARPRVRELAFKLPPALRPKERRFAMVLCLDGDGRIVDLLEDPAARYHFITGVREHDGRLYLGSLHENAVARVRL